MKKVENSFYENFNKIVHNKTYKRLNLFIKNNVWIVPLIYFVGTIALIIRNKIYELPFFPISLIQFAVIVVYVSVFLFMYSFVEYNSINVMVSIKKEKINILEIVMQLIFHIFLLFIICSILLCIGYYIFVPTFIIMLDNKYKIYNVAIVILYITLILEVPISLGGFKGQNVLYHDIETNTESQYIYYGNYDGLYQFSNSDNIYLIPLDNGYIIYQKNNEYER